MKTIAIIQARMGSTRLPGKVMLPLDGKHVLTHVVERTRASTGIDDVVVATSERKADDIVERYGNRAGASVFRGSESDVLGRIHDAARDARADIITRITADCPLISPQVIDEVVRKLVETGADYSANTQTRTLPRGLDAEAFTSDSFDIVSKEATEPHHREHVTYFYTENPSRFECVSVGSRDIFEEEWMHGRSDLRLTLDEADDYELLREVYDKVTYEDILDIRKGVKYIDDNELFKINQHVKQKST